MLTLATVTPGEPEIFASIQGEGRSAGKECTFIRLSRCNLACVWCDTAYTWHFDGDARPHRDGVTYDRAEEQVVLTEEQAAGRILALGQDRLVITGGEPILQAPALARMLALLRIEIPGIFVEIETNGTVRPPPALDRFVGQYNVSPKLAHSGNAAELALPPERLAEWVDNLRAWFKFVVASEADAREALALAEVHAIPRERILLMPEGTVASVLHAREEWLEPFCEAHGLTMSRRLHIEMFGDTRGT
ncbi:MAG: 7-carboxy-7-deazaguanine synthase QueE [Candidatus Andeanibacterium colombiense]|uniref:7-carboxy-7-deazaguanine synthase n=1 Tax=Candidatus Andeanibacterium colombiense TaxID=3121345 RepID=A0AAJ6BR34_9SPHN|nr:MAG: 7-carboxy-7-deazaguanine synthase QueE [Sphingomonadaceae bacterium]